MTFHDFEDMASSQLVVGNRAYAAVLLREASALHLRHGRHAAALAVAERGEAALVIPAASETGMAPPEVRERDALRAEACALAYWRGQALRGARKWLSAAKAFRAASPCDHYPHLATAATAEAAQLESLLEERRQAKQQRARRPPSAAAVTKPSKANGARATVDAASNQRRVLLLTFHGGVAASVRWAADQLGWDLSVPELDDEWLGGCDAHLEGSTAGMGPANVASSAVPELGVGSAVAPAAGGRIAPSARYRFNEAKAICLWRERGYSQRLEDFDLVIVGDTGAISPHLPLP